MKQVVVTVFTGVLFVVCNGASAQGLHQPALFCDSIFRNHLPTYVPLLLKPKVSLRPVTPDFYTCGFGFFCREELKMHNAHIPVSVRLGSKEQCDALEGK